MTQTKPKERRDEGCEKPMLQKHEGLTFGVEVARMLFGRRVKVVLECVYAVQLSMWKWTECGNPLPPEGKREQGK